MLFFAWDQKSPELPFKDSQYYTVVDYRGNGLELVKNPLSKRIVFRRGGSYKSANDIDGADASLGVYVETARHYERHVNATELEVVGKNDDGTNKVASKEVSKLDQRAEVGLRFFLAGKDDESLGAIVTKMQNKEFEAATADLEAFLAQKPGHKEALYDLLVAQIATQSWDAAMETAEELQIALKSGGVVPGNAHEAISMVYGVVASQTLFPGELFRL